MSGRIVPIARPVLDHEEFEVVREVLESGWLMNGPKVREFEKRFAEYCGVRFGVAVNSGTSALLAYCSSCIRYWFWG